MDSDHVHLFKTWRGLVKNIVFKLSCTLLIISKHNLSLINREKSNYVALTAVNNLYTYIILCSVTLSLVIHTLLTCSFVLLLLSGGGISQNTAHGKYRLLVVCFTHVSLQLAISCWKGPSVT